MRSRSDGGSVKLDGNGVPEALRFSPDEREAGAVLNDEAAEAESKPRGRKGAGEDVELISCGRGANVCGFGGA